MQAEPSHALDDSLPSISHGQDEVKEPHFFRLPPELRNDIYRLILPIDERFEIWARPGPAEPPILRTNRQIRNEAITIYYKENEWRCPVFNFDPRHYIAWSGRSPWRIGANIRWECVFPYNREHTFRYGWPNLKKWLEAYSRGACLRIEACDVKTKETFAGQYLTVAARLFEIVHDMRENHGFYWPEIESVLEDARQALFDEIISEP